MRGLIIDTETTGLSHNYNQVLTVGMLYADISSNGVDTIDTAHIKIKHSKYNVNEMALRINKINLKEHHKIGKTTRVACREINNFIKVNKIENNPLIGHNIGFDIRFLRELYRNVKSDYPFDWEVIDTRDLWKLLGNKGFVPSHLGGSLKVLANHFEINRDLAHDAIGDCYITANALHKMMRIIEN